MLLHLGCRTMLEQRGQQEVMVGRLLAGRDSQLDLLHQQLQQVSCAFLQQMYVSIVQS